MRQAILITAYRDMPQLERLIRYFDDDFELFVHIDKKCQDDYSGLRLYKNVHLFSHYKIAWGDVNHLKAILLLMNKAFACNDLEYFHLITGSDYPVLSLDVFKCFCEEHRNENYLEFFPLPHDDWGTEGGLNRIKYYWFLPSYRVKCGRLIEKSIKWQRKLGVNRPFSFFDGCIYGGGTYWSVSRKAIQVALEYLNVHPEYLRRFRMTSIAEEICLPTLWVNSGLSFVNNYLRYIDWGVDGGNPIVLTEKDYDGILASETLFARKFESGTSDQLIRMLEES